MKYLSLMFFLVFQLFQGSVFAETLGDKQPLTLEKMKASYVCGDQKGVIAFNEKTKKAWQSDLGQDHGLPLKVKSFKSYNCPGCLGFQGQLEHVRIQAKTFVQFGANNMIMQYVYENDNGDKINRLVPCKALKI